MNQAQEQRLEEIFKTNDNNGIAIAITGCWGVGKTFAWNKFLEIRAKFEEEKIKHLPAFQRNKDQRIFSKKYAYVSLFGIENLSDLKAAISTNMSSNYFNQESSKNFEIPTFIKKGLTALREVKLTSSEYGISSSERIFESMLYAQVKDAIICFDDFERMSKNLDIKDVMGLANQLKLERNCQVVLILDESKNEDENKKKYVEYKEKLIDETIKINSVEPLIRAKTKDIDDDLVNLMIKFAEELEIHNFRFFQKVIKLYKQFLEQLPAEVAYSTKEIILIRVLQGYLIEDYGQGLNVGWNDFTPENAIKLMDQVEDEELQGTKFKVLNQLNKVSYHFTTDLGKWLIEYKKWFDQEGSLDYSKLRELANSDYILEKNNLITKELRTLMNQWRNLQVDQDYCDCLFEKSTSSIEFTDLQELDFYCFLLKKFGRNDLSKKLKRNVMDWLDQELHERYEYIWDNATSFGYKKENFFHWYIKRWKAKNPQAGLPPLFDVLKVYILDGGIKNKANLVLKNAIQNDWENFIFSDSSVDEELKKIHKGKIMERILQQKIDIALTPLIKQSIEAILVNKLNSSNDLANKKNIEFVIDNFKKEGLL